MEWKRAILHVDMDAFFASVEVLDDPSLRGKPVIVGGLPEHRGVVAAASYEVRKFGVRSAMPTGMALRRCPHAVLIRPRHERYEEMSHKVMEILSSYTPLLEQVSVDEAFLDVTASTALFGPPEKMARDIKERIRKETGLTASVGVASNKFLAKLASDLEKPDGLTVILPGTEAARIAPLPLGRIWGVGPKSAERLESLGFHTIGEVAACPPERLRAAIGERWARDLQALARGEDEGEVTISRNAKSMSRETTFAVFISDPSEIEAHILALSEDVASRLRADGLTGRTVDIKVRDETFATVTRAETLPEPTDLGEAVFAAAMRLYREKVSLGRKKVRLLGVGVSGLAPRDAGQLKLFGDPGTDKRHRMAEAVDRVRKKLGDNAVQRGLNLKGGKLSRRGGWEGTDGSPGKTGQKKR
jgi:DNA polymerase-4